MKIPYLILTTGQQGGIGYPPIIIKFKNRWYAISDSRDKKIPQELELEHIKRFQSNYGFKLNPLWKTQSFVWKKWHTGPFLTWDKLKEKIRNEYIKLEIEGFSCNVPKNQIKNFLDNYKLPYE